MLLQSASAKLGEADGETGEGLLEVVDGLEGLDIRNSIGAGVQSRESGSLTRF